MKGILLHREKKTYPELENNARVNIPAGHAAACLTFTCGGKILLLESCRGMMPHEFEQRTGGLLHFEGCLGLH